MTISNLIRLARPSHWVKNVFVLFPVVFGLKMSDPAAWLQALLAAAGFCLVSSVVYIINDIEDRERDRLHPRKKTRPLASGQVRVGEALAVAMVLLVPGVAASAAAGLAVLGIVAAYAAMQMAYTFYLKGKMLVDVICIALGFVFRAAAGAAAISVEISPWLIVCTFTICLFMGFCKRRTEVVAMAPTGNSQDHRSTLVAYTPELLTHLITLSAAIAVISFLLYATSPRTVHHFGSNYLVYTLPVVVYGVCRFAMLSMMGKYSDPVDLILHDRAFQLVVVVWIAMALGLLVWGHDFLPPAAPQ